MRAVPQEFIESEVAILQNVEMIAANIAVSISKNDKQSALESLKDLSASMQVRREFWDRVLQEQP